MTVAVCFNCGEMKFGAFCACEQCGAFPQTEEQLSVSLALSDHCFDANGLLELRARVQRGDRIEVTPETKEFISGVLHESGILEQLHAAQGGTAIRAVPEPPAALPPAAAPAKNDPAPPVVGAEAEAKPKKRWWQAW